MFIVVIGILRISSIVSVAVPVAGPTRAPATTAEGLGRIIDPVNALFLYVVFKRHPKKLDM